MLMLRRVTANRSNGLLATAPLSTLREPLGRGRRVRDLLSSIHLQTNRLIVVNIDWAACVWGCVHTCSDVSIFMFSSAMQKRPPLGLEHSATAQPREYSIYKHLSQVARESFSKERREEGEYLEQLPSHNINSDHVSTR